MISFRTGIAALVFILASCKSAQKAGTTETTTINNIRGHIQYLADDKLEGRRTGTPGEKLAMEYISGQFKEIGLQPKGSNGFYQAFEVNDGKMINPGTSLSINNNKLEAGKDFFPFPYGANKTIEASQASALLEAGEPWIVDLKPVLEENKSNPHFDVAGYVRTNCKKAQERGATALILYNSSSIEDNLSFDGKDKSEQLVIPAVYVAKMPAQQYFKDPTASVDIKLTTDIGEKKRTGYNVVGYIDNGAATTVVLGAHFDHLGYGEDGNSMIRTGEKNIHNGADDNASGTAALIELSRQLKSSKATNNNYLFIAFSGEELGLYGSKYFTDHPTIDIKQVNYMINMDMVGRLNDSTHMLTIGGFGTSPSWDAVINNNDFFKLPYKTNTPPPLVIKIDSSGTGPSDHTSFYRKDIPVLFYFTGLHSDYHKPSDDADKINYTGEQQIIAHIMRVISAVNDKGRLAFTKTREAQTGTSTRFSVSLGIMPDYTFSGTGVRADGISEGKAAQKAGMKAGDIIIKLGDHEVTSVETYMQALGKFKKGDKTKVKFKRGTEVLEADVAF